MLSYFAYGLAILLSVGIAAIGARFLIAPRVAAAGYGIPARDEGDPAYLAVKGVRDIFSGILGLVLAAFAGHFAVALFMLVVAIVPLGDTVIVLRNGGAKATAFGIHFATAVVVLIDAALLFAL